jgi:hypothetical protein
MMLPADIQATDAITSMSLYETLNQYGFFSASTYNETSVTGSDLNLSIMYSTNNSGTIINETASIIFNPAKVLSYESVNQTHDGYLYYACNITLIDSNIGIPAMLPISPNPSGTGNVTLQWNLVNGFDNYSVYRSLSPITTLNGTQTLLGVVTVNQYLDVALTNGTYYFAIVAQNKYGSSDLSNCASVTVAISNPISSSSTYIWIFIAIGVAATIVIIIYLYHRHVSKNAKKRSK